MKYISGIIKDTEYTWLKEEIAKFENMSIPMLSKVHVPLDADIFDFELFSHGYNEFAYRCHDLSGKQELSLWVNEIASRVLTVIKEISRTPNVK
jgi:hypothetical protein